MKRIPVHIIIQPVFNINFVVLINHNVFKNHGFVMVQVIVLIVQMNHQHVNLNSVAVVNFNVRINDANHENFVATITMIAVIILMKKDVDNIFVHHSNGIVLVRVTAFIKLNYVMEKMIVWMVSMKRIAHQIFVHHWDVKPDVIHHHLAVFVLAPLAISWMNDFIELVPISMNVLNGVTAIKVVKIIVPDLPVHVLVNAITWK